MGRGGTRAREHARERTCVVGRRRKRVGKCGETGKRRGRACAYSRTREREQERERKTSRERNRARVRG